MATDEIKPTVTDEEILKASVCLGMPRIVQNEYFSIWKKRSPEQYRDRINDMAKARQDEREKIIDHIGIKVKEAFEKGQAFQLEIDQNLCLERDKKIAALEAEVKRLLEAYNTLLAGRKCPTPQICVVYPCNICRSKKALEGK